MANGVTKENMNKRVEFTMAMEEDRIAQLEEAAARKGLNRTSLIRSIVYEWLDASRAPTSGQ